MSIKKSSKFLESIPIILLVFGTIYLSVDFFKLAKEEQSTILLISGIILLLVAIGILCLCSLPTEQPMSKLETKLTFIQNDLDWIKESLNPNSLPIPQEELEVELLTILEKIEDICSLL